MSWSEQGRLANLTWYGEKASDRIVEVTTIDVEVDAETGRVSMLNPKRYEIEIKDNGKTFDSFVYAPERQGPDRLSGRRVGQLVREREASVGLEADERPVDGP